MNLTWTQGQIMTKRDTGGRGRKVADQGRFMSRAELAELMGVTPRAVRAWASKGTGPEYIRVGRTCRYETRDVEQWIKESKRKGSSGT